MNIAAMMKQVKDMQDKMTVMQTKLESLEITGQSGGGMVSITLNGKGDMRKLKLDPKLVDPNDIEMLEDLIVAAFSDAKAKVEAEVASQSEGVMGGLKLPPGLKLPF